MEGKVPTGVFTDLHRHTTTTPIVDAVLAYRPIERDRPKAKDRQRLCLLNVFDVSRPTTLHHNRVGRRVVRRTATHNVIPPYTVAPLMRDMRTKILTRSADELPALLILGLAG